MKKLRKKERVKDSERFSVMTNDFNHCYICGNFGKIKNVPDVLKLDLHEIFFAGNREKSKYYGLVVPLCHEKCHQGSNGVHSNRELDLALKRRGQEEFERLYPGEDFLEVFGRNYL